jgi:hypothetical protein
MKKDQVVISATANGKAGELYNMAGGDPVDTEQGEGKLIAGGDELTIACGYLRVSVTATSAYS